MTTVNTKKLILTSLFCALSCVTTMAVAVPSPTGGYINPGDAVVLLGAFILGPVWGAVAGGIGSAMADAFAGYVIYVPATLIIKAAMGFCAGLIVKNNRSKFALIQAGLTAEIIMIGGYFLFTSLILGQGLGALPEIPGNCLQGIFGIIVSCSLYKALSKTPYIKTLVI